MGVPSLPRRLSRASQRPQAPNGTAGYAKQPGRPPDLQKPFTLPRGATVVDLARHIHRDLPETMKFARLWGHGRFEGQSVHKTEPLQDRDIVEIHE